MISRIFSYSLVLAGLLITINGLKAQTFNDALRFSQLDVSGTARFMGTAGSASALGADFSTAFTNPAGMALFRKSELTFSPGFLSVRSESTLESDNPMTFLESANNFRLGNFGLIIASQPRSSKWTTVNFSIGLNRTASFQQEFDFRGRTPGSILDRFTALGDGLMWNQLDDFEAGIAFDVGAIYNDPFGQNNGIYINDLERFNPDHRVFKRQFVRQGGHINDLGITLAGNYDEKLQLGLTIGIPFYRFNYQKTYQEVDDIDEVPVFNNLTYQEFLNTSGTGFNMKMGVIYSPSHDLRVGVSVHTPTFLRVTENFSSEMSYTFTEQTTNTFSEQSPEGQFEYRLVTPWRFSGGVGKIIGGKGFISADIEFVDYTNMAFDFRSDNLADIDYQREQNDAILNRLSSVFNFKLGGEWAEDIWRLRAGALLDGTPFFGDNRYNFGYSLGAGIRGDSFYLDIAYIQRRFNQLYSPYLIENAPSQNVNNAIRMSQVVLTIGFKI